jgi:hypothetical protein
VKGGLLCVQSNFKDEKMIIISIDGCSTIITGKRLCLAGVI